MTDARKNGGGRLQPLRTECVSWRWNGNLGDDMIWSAQEQMFGEALALDQWIPEPEAVLVGGGTWIPKSPQLPDLRVLSARVPTALFTTGVDDPHFWGLEAVPAWKEIVDNARYVGVRGPQSVRWLEEMGFDTSAVSWIGDAALFYATPLRAYVGTGRVALNVGTTFDRLYGDDEDAVVDQLIEAARQLHGSGWDVSLVCAWGPDDVALERVKAAVPIRSVHHWHEDWSLALNEIEQFDVVVAQKLHVSVVAACRSVPFVSLAYRSKVDDFAESVGWESFSVSTDGLEADSIVGLVDELGVDIAGHTQRLATGVQAVRSKLLAAVPDVLRALQK